METATDATPMVYDSVLYVGRIDGFLYAISLTKQDTLWTFETFGQIAASPNRVSIGGKTAIAVGSYDNYLYLIDARTGTRINRFESGYYLNGAVAVSGSHLVYGGCDAWIRVVDYVSGVQTDSMEVESYIPASPAVCGNWVYIADHSGNIYELRLNRGRIASSQKIMEPEEESRGFVSVPAVSERMVFIVSDNRHLYAINRNDGSIAWRHLLKGDTGESSPVVSNDKVLVCTRNGIVSIHDANTGNLLWEYDTGEQILGSPAVINGRFYVLTARGTLFCFGAGR
jgi:outer membrane protein assembly factor BamB